MLRSSLSWVFRLYRFLFYTFLVVGENDQVARRWASSAFRAFFPSFSLGTKRFINSHPPVFLKYVLDTHRCRGDARLSGRKERSTFPSRIISSACPAVCASNTKG